MDANLAMNQEEHDFVKIINPNTAFYVHGIGLDLGRFQREGRARDEVRTEFGVKDCDILIVSIGELDDNKNHAVIIKALSILENKNFKYVVCGVGPNKDMLTKIAADAGLSNKVVLAGYRSDIPDILNAAEMFVFPSFHEGMPVAALEAMACGLPLVCSKIRGNVDIVKDDYNGYLVNPNNYQVFSDRIKQLIDKKEDRCRMGQINKELVKAYSLESVVSELKTIYSMN